MQRSKKYSGGGSSTTPGTDLGNDSVGPRVNPGGPLFNKSIERGFFTSPGGELLESMKLEPQSNERL